MASARSVKFFYDVVCPYNYMASRQVHGIEQRCGTAIEWVPVLLGGLYKNTQVR